MIRIAIAVAVFAPALSTMAQETTPPTWRDPDTRCIYFKVGDTLSLRYRRDGTPDCASLNRSTADETINQDDFRELQRSVEALRRDIMGLGTAIATIRGDLENIRREVRRPAQ